MNFDIEYVLFAVVFLVWLDIIVVLRSIFRRTKMEAENERRGMELAELVPFFDMRGVWNHRKLGRLFDNYLFLKQSITLPANERDRLLLLAGAAGKEDRLSRALSSPDRFRRMKAAQGLALIASDSARCSLETALMKERNYPVKLVIANAIADIKDRRSVLCLTSSLLGAHRWYREKVNMLIVSYGMAARDAMRGLCWRKEAEIRELLVDFAAHCITEEGRQYLADLLRNGRKELDFLKGSVRGCPEVSCAYCVHGREMRDDYSRVCEFRGRVKPYSRCGRFSQAPAATHPAENHKALLVQAAEIMEKLHDDSLDDPFFLEYPDRKIRGIAVRSLGGGSRPGNAAKLLSLLDDPECSGYAEQGLSSLLTNHPRFIPAVTEAFSSATGGSVRQSLAGVLAGRIEYFIARLDSRDRESSRTLIREILSQGKSSEIIEFLKVNRDAVLEEKVLEIVKEESRENETLREECGLYLPDRLLEKLDLQRIRAPARKREEKRDGKMLRSMYWALAFVILFFPAIYLAGHWAGLGSVPVAEHIKAFVVEFNYDFAWYSMAVNLVYLGLLGLSSIRVRTGMKMWRLKTISFLFKPRMLPSVSIIAPAYNEDKTIIESVNSLLNLKYPDYELIVVNDGSRDSTLDTLIGHYDLKRSDHLFDRHLKTAPVRGVYMNPLIPRLLVIDKENGGKADSLNAGINIASREYFCGIDADSLLEPDSLLKLASLTLDYGVETPAMGGNIFPINGCEVDRGKLMKIALPGNPLAKLQTIEYMRAFMCGRLGWAQLNTLLIISGAFGLFRRERVINIGGYLASRERYQKDTVGEDMELVVRIARMMREKKLKYRIGYAHNANCWTEVPEDIKSLKRQRDRWHRGLIDILFFHRRIIMNPMYGKMGLVGFPYFLVFEVIGPLFEFQGYIMIAVAIAFGLLNANLALLLFVTSILLGVFISMASVLIAERQECILSTKDTLVLLWMAVLENFGPRQMFSMWRVLGFFSAMKKPQGWGKLERKGFSPNPAASAPSVARPPQAAPDPRPAPAGAGKGQDS